MTNEIRRDYDFLLRAAFCGKGKFKKVLTEATPRELKALQKCFLIAQKIEHFPAKLKKQCQRLYNLSQKNIFSIEQYYGLLARIILFVVGYCFEAALLTACDTA